MDPKRKVNIPFWGLNTILAIAAFGWLMASFLLGKTQPGEGGQIASVIGIRLFEAILIGTSVGIAVNLYLKNALGETPKSILEKGHIDTIYTSRQSAEENFRGLIKNQKKVRRIDIIGASLRDFLMPSGPLRDVWEEIERRLEDEQRKSLCKNDRLHVRLLLLDPQSSEGLFRHKVEITTLRASRLSAGLPEDVKQGINEVSTVQNNIFNDQYQDFLQMRLYEHCPFSFMFITESELFIQQYGYRDHRKKSVIPFIKYLSDTPQYSELQYSFETIWKYARSTKESQDNVGTATALIQSKIKNIYIKEQRRELGNRQNECIAECIKNVKPGETINILAITGKFYVTNYDIFKTLRQAASKENDDKVITVKLAIINPISQQAILRGVADSSPANRIREVLTSWSWEKHRISKLYQDIHRTIDSIELWKEKCAFEIHLYSSSISCALLLTPSSKFIEQYVYGRSKKYREGLALGGEYPVFEYETLESEKEEKVEQEILTSTFDVVWDNYSIKVEDYRNADEEMNFNRNLDRLLEELNIKPKD